MALTSVYYDGPVTETDRAKNLAGAPEYGVYGPDDFKVTAHPSIPYAVLVKAGKAHGWGVTDTAAQDQVVQCATLAAGQVRWDLIVVRRNWQPALGGPSTLEAVQAGADPAIPATRKVGPGVEDDQPLFLVKWQGGTSAPVDFIDLRVWAGNGGLYAKSDLVRTYLTSIGTHLCIDGTDWTRRLGANDLPVWVRRGGVYSQRGFFGTSWNGPEEITVGRLEIPDQGAPYRIKVSGAMVTYSDVAAGLAARVRLGSVTGAQIGADAVKPSGIGTGLAYSLILASGGVSDVVQGASRIEATIKRTYGAGNWLINANESILTAEIIPA